MPCDIHIESYHCSILIDILFPCGLCHRRRGSCLVPATNSALRTTVCCETETSGLNVFYFCEYSGYFLYLGKVFPRTRKNIGPPEISEKLNFLLQLLSSKKNPQNSSHVLHYTVCVCFLPIYSGLQVRWTYQPGSHRRKVTQDFSSTVLLRCVP